MTGIPVGLSASPTHFHGGCSWYTISVDMELQAYCESREPSENRAGTTTVTRPARKSEPSRNKPLPPSGGSGVSSIDNFRNGQTKAVGKYADGELDGDWEWWRENGQPLQAGEFANRVQVGTWKRYYENGQLWDEGQYQDGKKVGEWTTYDKSGNVKQQKHFKPK